MPEDQDEKIEGLDTSEQADDVTSPVEENSAEGAADPSSASDKPEEMLSVVRDVVSKTDEPASQADDKTKDAGAAGADPAEPKDPDDTDYSDVPFNRHPRFQQLLRKSKAYEADASRYRDVETYLSENNLSADEAADGIRIMALAKADPAKALAEIKPFITKLLIAAGEVLPDDLKSRVQGGEMPAAAAQEISRHRAQLENQRQQAEFGEQRRQQEAENQRVAELGDSARQWAADRDQKDPAFKEKYPLLEREVAFLQRREGVPNTPEGVRDQLNRAYGSVNQQARAVATQPRSRAAVRPLVGGAAPGTQTPEPKSMLDAIRAARGA